MTERDWLRRVLEDRQLDLSEGEPTFENDELDHYLAVAGRDYAESRQRVYRAAVLALDALLTGAATAVNFGAGSETFDMASVFERLTSLRATLAAETYPRPAVYNPPVVAPLLGPLLGPLGVSTTVDTRPLPLPPSLRQPTQPLIDGND